MYLAKEKLSISVRLDFHQCQIKCFVQNKTKQLLIRWWTKWFCSRDFRLLILDWRDWSLTTNTTRTKVLNFQSSGRHLKLPYITASPSNRMYGPLGSFSPSLSRMVGYPTLVWQMLKPWLKWNAVTACPVHLAAQIRYIKSCLIAGRQTHKSGRHSSIYTRYCLTSLFQQSLATETYNKRIF